MSAADSPRCERVHVRADALTRHFTARASLLGGGPVVRALEQVSLSITRGGALGVIGESGCGKTTLGRALLRLVEPTSGRAVIDGLDLGLLDAAALRAFRRRAQIVFQDSLGALDPRQSAAGAIAEPLALHRVVEPAVIPDEVARLLQRVGLDPCLAERRPHELSGGQRQRVCIARALASRPGFLVADEPTGALDASLRAHIAALLAALRSDDHLTLLLISHDLAVVRHLCDRVAVMYLGRIVEEGAAAAILGHPRHPYTQALLAAEPAWPPSSSGTRPPRLRIADEHPSAIAPPHGCSFHPRCPRYQSRDRPLPCRTERPSLEDRGDSGGTVACHFPD